MTTNKNYFEIQLNNTKIRYYWGFKLLPSSFSAIALFGRVYSTMSKDDLYNFLNTKPGMIQANHERIHILQARSFRLRYLSFYALYIYYFLKNFFNELFTDSKLFKSKDFKHIAYHNFMSAYYKIPFEQEAYSNQTDFDYSESNYKNYLIII